MNAAGFSLCLALQRAHASLSLKLDDELSVRHGIDFTDFVLLDLLASANAGQVMTLAGCVHPSGLQRSAALKRLLALEKIGLVERIGMEGCRELGIRPAGRSLTELARETVSAICEDAIAGIPITSILALKQSLIDLADTDALKH